MRLAFSHLDELSASESRELEAVLDRFEDDWRTDSPPSIQDYAAGRPLAILTELVHTDLEYRRLRGECVTLQDYWTRFPQLRPECAAPLRSPGNGDAVPSANALGKYDLRRIVGRGTSGVVYEAWDRELNRRVALKLPYGIGQDDEGAEPCLREARIAARLSHPGIVAILELGRSGLLPFIVSEFVDGPSLAQLTRRRKLSGEEAANLIASVADAVHYAHLHGVIHRDLKPANILLQHVHGNSTTPIEWDVQSVQVLVPKITDFGLAHSKGQESLTAGGTVLGTPAYMSPEQARGEAGQVGSRSDVYSLGAILYELMTGRLPYSGSSHAVLTAVVGSGRPILPKELDAQIPEALQTICLRAMARSPAQRYPTAGALAEDLRRFLSGKAVPRQPLLDGGRVPRHLRTAKGALLCYLACLGLSLLALSPAPAPDRPIPVAPVGEANWPNQHDLLREASLDLGSTPKMKVLFGPRRDRQLSPVLVEYLDKTIRLYQQVLRHAPNDEMVLRHLARDYARRAFLYKDQDRFAEAEADFLHSVDAFRCLSKDRLATDFPTVGLSCAYSGLANVVKTQGRLSEARIFAKHACDWIEKKPLHLAKSPPLRERAAWYYLALGNCCRQMKDYEGCRLALKKSLDYWHTLPAEFDLSEDARRRRAQTAYWLAESQLELGQRAEAAENLTRAQQQFEELTRLYPAVAKYRDYVQKCKRHAQRIGSRERARDSIS